MLDALRLSTVHTVDSHGNRRVEVAVASASLTIVVDDERGLRDHNVVGGLGMAVYTYDKEADVLYVLLVPDADGLWLGRSS